MAKSAKQRQAEYRARRWANGQCLEAGCPNWVRKYSRCAEHRTIAKEDRAETRSRAAEADILLEENKVLRVELVRLPAQAKLRAAAQGAEDLELTDAIDELHTESQSAMGYTDNATVWVSVTGEKRPNSQGDRLPSWQRLLSSA